MNTVQESASNQQTGSKRLSFITTGQTNPYKNLAMEEFLLWNVCCEECILYLWQNRHTVVIGVNQNPWKECHVKELEQDGGFLARRMSGGGAVFHDLGNLNFTFLVREEDYDVGRQLDVIIRAVRKFGIFAERSGRNDVLTDGRKFSGNAFFNSRGHCYHHGTLLLDVEMSNLSKYLNVSHDKLQSKGVSSVRSRVINLRELAPEITVESLKKALIEAFGEVYGGVPQPFPDERLNPQEVERYEEKYSSWEWRMGRKLPFTTEYGNRFAWGDLTFQFCVESGIIRDAIAYSDSMDTNFIYAVSDAVKGSVFSSSEIKTRLLDLARTKPVEKSMLDDIISLIEQNNF
ncbi:MAG: lipoate--protein ligase [Tannerella sp.]|jgi:lipoate-protein ligase A|nr:lipoate--protein ligase [Tannerella sp.]